MKHTLLIALMFSIAVPSAEAQKIRFTDTTNKWTLVAFTSDPSSNPASARYVGDTIIAGMVYHRLATNSPVVRDTLAVREDTAIGKIYFRFLASGYRGIPADTLERVLFDYRLSAGDTLKAVYGNYTLLHIVERLDSVQLGAYFYKHWVMRLSSTLFGFSYGYEFIEGIGANESPVNIFYYGLIPVRYQLRCFLNNGIRPSCKPAVHVPLGYYRPTYPWEPIPVDSFDNNASCSFKYVGISFIAMNVAPIVSPNPGGKDISLSIPESIFSASLQVTDIAGRKVLQKVINARRTNIGQYLSAPGVYYYTLQDAATGQRYTGRFIFR